MQSTVSSAGQRSVSSASGGFTSWPESPGSACCTTSTSCRSRRSPRTATRRGPATSPSTRSPAGPCGGSVGQRSAPSSSGILITIVTKDYFANELRQAGRWHRDQHRHVARHHHDAQRVGRDLAQSEGRAGQCRQRHRRRRARSQPRPQPAARRSWRRGRTSCSPSRCCSSWSSRATARHIARHRGGQRQDGCFWAITIIIIVVMELNALGLHAVEGNAQQGPQHDVRRSRRAQSC